jgi:hypothetical protein
MADNNDQNPPPPPPGEPGGDFDDLKKQAKNLFFRAALKVEEQAARFRESESGKKLQALLKVAQNRYTEAKDSETAARLKELAGIARENASALSDSAANRLAAIYRESTGKEVTPDQVKRAAVKMGVTALVTAVAFTFLRRIPGVNARAVLAGLKKMSGSFGSDLSEFFGEETPDQDDSEESIADGGEPPPEAPV